MSATMDISLLTTLPKMDRECIIDGINAVNSASAETGKNMWNEMKKDPDDPEITGATRAKYNRLFEENETKVVPRWCDLLNSFQNKTVSFQDDYPTFGIWAEAQKTGFMFTRDADFHLIGTKMTVGHSGSSYAWTMRQLQYIAKNGFDAYVDLMNGGPRSPPRAATPVPEVMPLMEVSPVHNRANTGGAIPRHVCMCRNQQGLMEGWCGVASGGIPACEY